MELIQINNLQQLIIQNYKLSHHFTLHEFSQNVGQEKVDVTLLVPIGVEPHDWEPTIKDVQRIQNLILLLLME